MSEQTPTPAPWIYGKRPDGSFWISLGEPVAGRHEQFDWYGQNEASLRLACTAPDLRDALADALRMLKAVRYTVGLAKGQIARIEKAEAVIAKAEGRA